MLYIAVHVATPLLPETLNPCIYRITMCRGARAATQNMKHIAA